ncbi:MAG: TonB-dependent receptor [Bryobacteraceae bacterium]|nr:TonB-dependent receptor [Bryobacteraceae bacterium]
MRSNFFLTLALAAAPLGAQEITASIYGSVVDGSGAAVAGAKVLASSALTGASQEAISDTAGEFTLRGLQSGEYTLTIEAAGFRQLRQTGVALSAGQRARLDFRLEVGQLTQTVEVTATAPLLNSVNAEQRSNLSAAQVNQLPVSRRDWTSLLELENGVDNRGGRVSMNGLPASSFRLTVDGTDSTMDTEAPSLAAPDNYNLIRGVSMEAIEEVNLARGIASAEVGQTMSGNVNINTKRGTNEFHGSLFAVNQTENLNARNQFQSNKPGVVYNQFGGSFGGPIVRNKLFAFGVYEGYRLRGFQAFNGNVPTPEFKRAAIAAVPAYKQALDLFPDPNTPYAPTANNATYIGAGSDKANDNHAVIRGDYHVTDRLILTARYTRGRPFRETPRIMNNPRNFVGQNEIGTFNAIYARSSWTAETRFGVNQSGTNRSDYLHANGIPGITGSLGWSVSGETLRRDGITWSIEELIGMTRGRHSIKFGGILSRPDAGRENVESPEVTYANAADFLANNPNAVRVTFGVREFKVRTENFGFFIQDDFRVNRRLTLSLGLRWDYFAVPNERDNRLFNRDEPFGFGPFLPGDQAWKATRNDFSPRVGIAWNVDGEGRTVIRTGAGIFQNPRNLFGGPVDIVQNSLNEPFRVEYARADVLRYPDLLRYPVYNDKVLPIATGPQALIGGTAINPNWGTPMSYQWLFTIQRQLPFDIALETGYNGTRGIGLMMVRFMNPPDRVTGIRPVNGYAQFRYRDAAENSNYHAWQTSVRKRFGSGFLLGINYTWSKSLSYSNQADLLLPNAPQDIDNIRADYGPVDGDQKHRFIGNFVYELPFAQWANWKSGVGRHILGGWQLSGVFRANTGSPVTIVQPTGLNSSRPDYNGAPAELSNYRDTLQYLDRAAFPAVPLGAVSRLPLRPGTIGRNAIRGPGAVSTNLTVAKTFIIRERSQFQFRADFFNAFNQTNLGGLVARIDAANFGRLTSAGSRQVQLSARFTF